jgi:UDP-N-acetylglucosamine 4,6-dehydratase|tara:strand:+ start:1493 stop:2461 length:969 start_codon:yes stop_codon:yes gene_type:complete
MKEFNNKVMLITGGTGSFGQNATQYLLKNTKLKKLIIYSRDENKQFEMQNKFKDKRLRFFIGDVRDQVRLEMALIGVDLVIHAAALKHVPAAEYNPFESIKTNIQGSQSVVFASIKNKVKKVITLSTDKACNPINLYGATKLCSEKIFVNANNFSGKGGTIFGVVRYGNVIASRGSVVPFFKKLIREGKKELPLTHKEMTRFFITLPEAIEFVLNSFNNLKKGEIFIPKMPSILILDLIKILDPKVKIKIVGIRPGEKKHETLCSIDESSHLYENKNFFTIYPSTLNVKTKFGKKVKENFVFSSNLKSNLDKAKVKKILNSI